jgi:hypothetical protein
MQPGVAQKRSSVSALTGRLIALQFTAGIRSERAESVKTTAERLWLDIVPSTVGFHGLGLMLVPVPAISHWAIIGTRYRGLDHFKEPSIYRKLLC